MTVPEKDDQATEVTEAEFEEVLAALLQVDPEGIVGTSAEHRRKRGNENDQDRTPPRRRSPDAGE